MEIGDSVKIGILKNTFEFDGRDSLRAYRRNLKGVLMWQSCLSKKVDILSSVVCHLFIHNSTCSTTHVAVIPLSCGTIVVVSSTSIDIVVCSY